MSKLGLREKPIGQNSPGGICIRMVCFISLVLLAGCSAPTPPVPTRPATADQPVPAVSRTAPVETAALPAPSPLPATPTNQPAPSQTPAAEPSPVIPTGTLAAPQPEPSTPPLVTATPLPRLHSNAAVTLVYIQMADAQTGWAIDSIGRILHTGSGAQSWEDVTPPEGIYWPGWNYEGTLRAPGGFFALDGAQAWAVPYIQMCLSETCPAPPETATVWRTSDGGQTWQPSRPFCPNWSGCDVGPGSPGFYDHALYPVALQFIDQHTGWLLAVVDHMMFQERYGLYRTTDGGSTWELLVTNETPGMTTFNLTGMGFINAQTGWIATSEIGGAASPAVSWQLLQTGNGGETFQTLNLPAPGSLPAYFASEEMGCGQVSLRVIPPSVVDVTSSCANLPGDFHKETFYAFHSTDGGQTWAVSPASRSVYFLDAAYGWKLLAPVPIGTSPMPAQGSALPMRLQRTTDGGKTWDDLRQVSWNTAQFSFATPLDGWAVVVRGGGTDENGKMIIPEVALIQTADGGQTWQMLKPKTK